MRSEFAYDDPDETGNLTEQLTWDSTRGSVSTPLVAGSSGNAIGVANTYDSDGNLYDGDGRVGSVNTAKNNGQLAQVDGWIGTTQEYRQQYKYDCLNRLTNSKEKYGTSLGSTAYDINYEYDAFGNRYQKSSANSGNSTITQKWAGKQWIIDSG